MARVPCKRLVLVAFVLLCFISLSDGARSLGVAPSVQAETNKVQVQDDHVLIPAKENGEVQNVDELVTVDYTPARRKPPIHN